MDFLNVFTASQMLEVITKNISIALNKSCEHQADANGGNTANNPYSPITRKMTCVKWSK